MSINIRAEIMTVRIVDNTGAQGVTELTLKAMVEVMAPEDLVCVLGEIMGQVGHQNGYAIDDRKDRATGWVWQRRVPSITSSFSSRMTLPILRCVSSKFCTLHAGQSGFRLSKWACFTGLCSVFRRGFEPWGCQVL